MVLKVANQLLQGLLVLDETIDALHKLKIVTDSCFVQRYRNEREDTVATQNL